MKKILGLIVLGAVVCSVAKAQNKVVPAKPVYDNVQQEQQRKAQAKMLTYKKSESMPDNEAKANRPLTADPNKLTLQNPAVRNAQQSTAQPMTPKTK